MLLILIIPTAIVGSTVAAYLILSKGFSSYFNKIESKAAKIQRIHMLLIASDLVSLFSRSESKTLVDGILSGAIESDDFIFNSLKSSFGGAGLEIERLYMEISSTYKPSEEISRIKISADYLRAILLFYGFSVSISQYIIIAYFYQSRGPILISAILDMIIATVLFSSIFIFISVYILVMSQHIEIGYSKLQNNGSKIRNENEPN